jgi:hypothetical protein
MLMAEEPEPEPEPDEWAGPEVDLHALQGTAQAEIQSDRATGHDARASLTPPLGGKTFTQLSLLGQVINPIWLSGYDEIAIMARQSTWGSIAKPRTAVEEVQAQVNGLACGIGATIYLHRSPRCLFVYQCCNFIVYD